MNPQWSLSSSARQPQVSSNVVQSRLRSVGFRNTSAMSGSHMRLSDPKNSETVISYHYLTINFNLDIQLHT